MKVNYSVFFAVFFFILSSCDVQNTTRYKDIFNNNSFGGTPTSIEISQGIKQALELGALEGITRLSGKDGFLGNNAIKILFPPEAIKIENTLRKVGLNSLADNVIVSLNRAAEGAMKEAKPIFVSAIKQMTIADATQILLGNNNAATEYFKRVTSNQLVQSFSPIISKSLNKEGATQYWSEAVRHYNSIPFVNEINPDLSEYVTEKAVQSLFFEIAKEELKIRENFGARSSPILKKVFGYADRQK